MHVHASEYLRNNGMLNRQLTNGNPGENEVGFFSEGGYGVLLVRRNSDVSSWFPRIRR